MKNFNRMLFLPLWFLCTIGLTSASIALVKFTMDASRPEVVEAQNDLSLKQSYNYPTGEVKGIATVYEVADARPEIVARFLKRHSSPMQPHDEFGQKLVEIADTHGLDYRLLPAIAMQESNLCRVIPENSYNCLGFGVHSKGTLRFESYEVAFDTAARGLKNNYIDIGLTTPERIMKKYTPSSNGSWAASVNQWIAEMEYDSREMGKEKKQDADLMEYLSTSSASLE